MACLQVLAATAPSQLKLGFHRPRFHSFTLLRHSASPSCESPSSFKNAVRLQVRQKLLNVCASSNSSPSSGGDSAKNEIIKETEASYSNKGPPLLSILAGFLVFALVCWLFGSIVVWLFGLVAQVPPK